jgi:hypothetical protein
LICKIVFIVISIFHFSCFAQNLYNFENLPPSLSKHLFFDPQKLDPLTQLNIQHEYFVPLNLLRSDNHIFINNRVLLNKHNSTCSAYDTEICHSLGDFYTEQRKQVLFTGVYKYDHFSAFLFGFNTGYDSNKLKITPSLMLGHSNKFVLDRFRMQTLTITASFWLNGVVQHKPCLDDFDREYYCRDLTAWSDFKYQRNPASTHISLWYRKEF